MDFEMLPGPPHWPLKVRALFTRPICAIMRGFLPPWQDPLPHRGINGGGLSGRKATSER